MKKIILMFVFVGILINCRGSSHVNRLAQISEEISLKFPTGSSVVEYQSNLSVIDPIWVAKVKIPLSEIREFRGSIEKIKDAKINYSGGLAYTVAWWNPINPTATKTYYVGDNVIVLIVISEEKKESFAYIERAVF